MKRHLVAFCCFLFAAAVLVSAGCGPSQKEAYTGTNLAFSATVRWKPDAKFVDSPEGRTCSGIEVEKLRLGDRDIPLGSNTVTSDCLIQTKDHGAIEYNPGAETIVGQSQFLITAKQAEEFKKLAP